MFYTTKCHKITVPLLTNPYLDFNKRTQWEFVYKLFYEYVSDV